VYSKRVKKANRSRFSRGITEEWRRVPSVSRRRRDRRLDVVVRDVNPERFYAGFGHELLHDLQLADKAGKVVVLARAPRHLDPLFARLLERLRIAAAEDEPEVLYLEPLFQPPEVDKSLPLMKLVELRGEMETVDDPGRGMGYGYRRAPATQACSFNPRAISVLSVRRVPSRMIFGQSFDMWVPPFCA
jgi:hypothetical protein